VVGAAATLVIATIAAPIFLVAWLLSALF